MEVKITLLDHLTGVFLVKLRPASRKYAKDNITLVRPKSQHQRGGSFRRKQSKVSFVDDGYDDPEITHPTINKMNKLHFKAAPNRRTSNNFEASIMHLHNLQSIMKSGQSS